MDELLGRRAPYSAPAEQAVLGSMLIDPRCIPEVIGKVKSQDFYIQTNREIFETMFSMFSFGRNIDPVTVMGEMKSRGVFKDDSTEQYLRELMDITPTAANVLEYAAIVSDRALQRALAQAADEIQKLVYEGAGAADSMLEAAERKIFALGKDRFNGGLEPVATVVQRVYDGISEAANSDSSTPGISTGIRELDSTILGMGPGDFILVASRPGMGKTSIGLNIALSAAKSTGRTVAVFSLEMTREQLVMRLLAGEGLVDSKKLQTGRLSNDEWQRVGAAAGVLSGTDIRIDDNPSLTVSEMNAQCRRLKNLGLIVIDYHQPHDKDHGQGARRAGALPEPALARERVAPEQAAHALGPARVRRHRAGRRRRHGYLPRGLLQRRVRKPERSGAHHPQEPPRADGDDKPHVAAGVHLLRGRGQAARR